MQSRSWLRLSGTCAVAMLIAACGGGGGEDSTVESAEAAAEAAEAAGSATATIVMTRPALESITTQGETTCADRSIGVAELDNLFVPDGRACQLDGTRFKGSIKVGTNSTLEAQKIRVSGNIQAEGSRLVKVINGSTVGGSVQIKQGRAATISGTRVTGDLQFDEQTRAVRANRNEIGGNLQAVSNTGGVTLNTNTMIGNLQCKQNMPAPTGGGNVAASKEGQCRRL